MITQKYQEFLKSERMRRRCLHYSDNIRCNKIISAHSIQKRGQLDLIQEQGHVYRFSSDLSILKQTNGLAVPKKVGVNIASTFYGFCKKHDNLLFSPIDNDVLTPDKQKLALYAYRCLAREQFVLENAVLLFSKFKDNSELDANMQAFLKWQCNGKKLGLYKLKKHKEHFDLALSSNYFEDFEFIYFTSKSSFNIQASSVLYPDYDFLGRELQDTDDASGKLGGCITFFTAPVLDGWAFGFCWHKTSNEICIPYIESIAALCSRGQNLEDLLVRLVFSTCENHAIKISWWDGLAESNKKVIAERFNQMMNPIIGEMYSSYYLREGCEGIADWSYQHVYHSNYS